MESLPTEILLQIIESSESIPELLKYRNISRNFRNLIGDKCKHRAFELGRQHIQAFDDALLAIRLKRIPFESCCYYDLQSKEYFNPTKDFLQAVMGGTEVPPGCPTIPAASWFEEIEAVVDLYLLALAWMSTTTGDGGINSSEIWPGGIDLRDVDVEGERPKPMTEAYLRSIFRILAVTALYGPRVIAEPVSVVSTIVAQDADMDGEQKLCVRRQESKRYPIFTLRLGKTLDDTAHSIFDGFFRWLYAQSEPRDVLSLPSSFHNEEDPVRSWDLTFTEEERQQVALVQLMKLYDIMYDRNLWTDPDPNQHVASLFYPMYHNLTHAVTVYRPRLQISAWAEPQEIINAWAKSETASLVTQLVAEPIDRIRLGGSVFSDALDGQLRNKFRLTYETQRLDLLGIDYGVLDPRSELHDLE
jgi:hypothetical protein